MLETNRRELVGPNGGLTNLQLETYQRDGYLIVRGLFSGMEVAAIREAFMDASKDGPLEGISDTGIKARGPNDPLARYPRMMHPHLHPQVPVGKIALDYLLEPRLEVISRDLLDDEPIAAQTMFYFKPPGARGQALHQDNFYLRVQPGTCLAAWMAVDDCDLENGGMMVVPGSHNLDIACPETSDPNVSFGAQLVRPPEGHEAVLAAMRAGDVLFFNGSLIHGSEPNSSQSRFRRSLIAHYVPAGTVAMSEWFKDMLRFDGSLFNTGTVSDGGPCGTDFDYDKISLH